MDHKLYLSDKGIYRVNGVFYFYKTNKIVKDLKITERLKRCAVPPAWTHVWYASNPKCHIQVCGIDQGGKKQYILSDKWIQNSKYEKFNRMKKFIKQIPSFKKLIELKRCVITRESLIHLLFNLLIDLHVRVGNEIYAENNSTYGLTTLRQRHLKIFNNGNFQLKFIGKSNIEHCVDIPSQYNQWFIKLKTSNKNSLLFTYDGKCITSEDLNEYLKTNMGKEYTCKDFRTYSANMLFINSFLKNCKTVYSPKKCVLMSIDESAQHLGHTRSISRKSYISESLIDYCITSFTDASCSSSCSLLSRVWSSVC